MTLKKLKPGMTVWSVGTYGVGNTTLRSVGVWPAKIFAVNEQRRTVDASLNGNARAIYWERTWSKWRLKKPTLVRIGFNCYRLATPEEEKAQLKSKQTL